MKAIAKTIAILVAVILLILALFLIAYLLLALFRIPPRSFPQADNELYWEYLYEPVPAGLKFVEPEAPPGLRYSSVPLLASTNLVFWEVIMCRADAKGHIHTSDGATLRLNLQWNEEAQEWQDLKLDVVRAGTNGVVIFKLP